MRYAPRAILACGLGFAVSFVVACGGGSGLLSGDQSNALSGQAEQISSAVNMIVQQTRFSDGSRKVTCISEVTGLDGDQIQIQDVFYFKQEGFNKEGKLLGRHVPTGYIPRFYEQLRQRGMEPDLSIFRGEEG